MKTINFYFVYILDIHENIVENEYKCFVNNLKTL